MNHATIPVPDKILCVRVGHSSQGARVAVGTQGDKGVHVYDFGSNTRIAHLKDPTMSTPVSAIAMDSDQSRLVTGAESGSLRVFDLRSEQLIRTFGNSSHKTVVTSVDYHPYGEFVVSASADTVCKVWDVRKKTCIQAYKQVPVGLTVARCCPDGKGVVTGCEQGALRVYDLTQGKMREQVAEHTSAITGIGFHSSSMICCTGSLDGTVNVLDFQTYSKIFSYSGLSRGTDQVLFGPRTLHATSNRSFYTWECEEVPNQSGPMKCVDAPWSSVGDSIYSDATDEILLADVKTQSQGILCCTVPLGNNSGKKFVPPTSRTGLTGAVPSSAKVASHTPTALPQSRMQATPHLVQAALDNRNPIPGQPGSATGQSPPLSRPNLQEMRRQKKLEKQMQEVGGDVTAPSPVAKVTPQRGGQAFSIPTSNQKKQAPQPKSTVSDMAQRLDFHGEPASGNDEEAVMLHKAAVKSQTLSALLQRRLTQIKVVRQFWATDVTKALGHILHLAKQEDGSADQGTVVDFLTTMNTQRMREKITMDTFPQILDIVTVCLNAVNPTETVVLSCFRLTRSFNSRFKSKIEEGLKAARHASVGVDLALEAKVDKAKRAYRGMVQVNELAQQYSARKDSVGEEARLLLQESL